MNLTYFLFFICIIVCTLIITYWAVKRSNSTSHFYTAAGSITGIQNGMAISGDFISAASFLGIIGAIALYGYDGLLYFIGFLFYYLIVISRYFISSASFLGIICAIALYGYDGFLYSIGFLVSYLIVLFLIAESFYHLGKYSLGDVLCARFPSNKVRGIIAFGTFII